MNKVGEGNNPAKGVSSAEYHKALGHDCVHFLASLRQYVKGSSAEKNHLSSAMEKSLKLILSSVVELKRRGIAKEGVVLEKAYQLYMKDSSAQNYAALEHAVVTLQEFNC